MEKLILIMSLILIFTTGCAASNTVMTVLVEENEDTVIQQEEEGSINADTPVKAVIENKLAAPEKPDSDAEPVLNKISTSAIAAYNTKILNVAITNPSVNSALEVEKKSILETPWQMEIESDMPYMVEVDVANKIVTIFGQDENGYHTKIVRQMICSVGKPDRPTLLGTFTIPETERVDRLDWAHFPSGVWARYFVRINGPYLFHSIPYSQRNIDSVIVDAFHALGEAVSIGCVRLLVADARWVYENIQPGTVVKLLEKTPDPYLTKWFDPVCMSANAEDAVFPFPTKLIIEGFGEEPLKVGDSAVFGALVHFDNQTVLDKTFVVDWNIENEELVTMFGNTIKANAPGTIKFSVRYRHLETQIELNIVKPESMAGKALMR